MLSVKGVQDAVHKLPAPLEAFSTMLQAFLSLADPAVDCNGTSGGAATAAALGRSSSADRLTICRAMTATYSAHAAEIGKNVNELSKRGTHHPWSNDNRLLRLCCRKP